MIWVRRILAVPVAFLFAVTFLAAMLLTHVSGTVGSAGFYNGQMDQAGVYDWVHQDLTPAMLSDSGEESPTDFPIDTPQIRLDMAGVLEQAFPAAWLKSTFEDATGEMVPYMVGDTDTFVVAIAVKERIDPMVNGINDVIDNHADQIYGYVTEDLMVPAVTEELGDGAALPYGIRLSPQEISDIVTGSMPQGQAVVLGWFKEMVGTMADYVKGDVASLDLVIDLTQVKAQAVVAANQLVDQKLRDAFNSMPATCSEMQFLAELQGMPRDAVSLPSCRPPAYSYEQFRQALETRMGRTFAQAVDQEVTARIPGSYRFDDDQMRETLGEDTADSLDQARKFIVEDRARITDQNLQDLGDSEDDPIGMSAAERQEDLDNARHAIHLGKVLIPLVWVVSILLLVAVGFLLGRSWKGRLLWGLGTFLVAALIFAIAIGVAGAVAPIPDRIVERPEGQDATQVGIVTADKGDEMVHNAIDTLIWGLEVKFIICVVVSAVAMAGVIGWYLYDRRRRRELAPADASGMPVTADASGMPVTPDAGGLPLMPADSGDGPATPAEAESLAPPPADAEGPPQTPGGPGSPPP